MSAESALMSKSFPVGRYQVTLSFPKLQRGKVLHMAVEWAPDVPDRLTVAEMRQYQHGRNQVVQELAAFLGKNVAVIG